MASYAVADDEVAKHATLVASTVDTVTFDPDPEYVEVASRDGAAEIYFTTDGSTPTVGGQNCYVVPAFPSARTARHGATGGAVKLISSGTPAYSVTRA